MRGREMIMSDEKGTMHKQKKEKMTMNEQVSPEWRISW